jgi:hypothetical protein
VRAGGGVVGAHLDQPGDLLGGEWEQRDAWQQLHQCAGESQRQVVAPGQMGSLVGEHRR